MTATVVIPALDEEKHIASCLESLCAQATREPFDVIVVDNGSTDHTTDIARGYQGRLQVRVIQEKQRGRGAARATGFAYARGEFIFSTDADAVLPLDWIESFLTILRTRPGVVAVTCAPRIEDCTPRQNWLFNRIIPYFLRINIFTLGHHGLCGFSFAIPRDIYERSGGFNRNADAYEDLDLARRVRKFGTIVFDIKCRVTFSGRRFRNGLLRGWSEYIITFIKKFIFHKDRVILSTMED